MGKNWYVPNGQPPRHRRTPRLERWSNAASVVLTKLRALPPPVRLGFVLMLIVLAGLLAGCATTSTPSSVPARIPSPPPPTLSERSETYSSSAARNISEWQKRLTELLPKP